MQKISSRKIADNKLGAKAAKEKRKTEKPYVVEIADRDFPCDICSRLIRKGSKYALSKKDSDHSHIACNEYFYANYVGTTNGSPGP